LEIATPWNLACFKVKGGAKAYFHGGLSPQELLIPVITIKSSQKPSPGLGAFVEWKLIPGSPKITTRFFSIQVIETAIGLFDFMPPKVRVEIRSGSQVLSTPVSASYGFSDATGDVQLKISQMDPKTTEPNTITLMITKEQNKKINVTIYLFDANTGDELAQLENIEMAIAI
jgi:hypothetical protein